MAPRALGPAQAHRATAQARRAVVVLRAGGEAEWRAPRFAARFGARREVGAQAIAGASGAGARSRAQASREGRRAPGRRGSADAGEAGGALTVDVAALAKLVGG